MADAASACDTWSEMEMAERGRILNNLADLLEEHAEDLAAQTTREMGKNTREALGEVKYCARIIRYYANEGERLAADQELKNIDGQTAILRRRPIGTILGIMPWNFSYYQVVRFAAPNLMLGNTVILQDSAICSGTALTCQELIRQDGWCDGRSFD